MFATLIAARGVVHGQRRVTTYLEWTDSFGSRRCRSDPRAAELVLHKTSGFCDILGGVPQGWISRRGL